MNGWLVLLRHGMDDIPVRLFNTLAEAQKYASERKPYLSTQEEYLFDCSPSTPIKVTIVEFKNNLPVHCLEGKQFPRDESDNVDNHLTKE